MSEAVASGGGIPLRRPKYEIYARERSLLASPEEAARRAGLASRSGAASRLERNPAIAARIAHLLQQDEAILSEKRRRLEEQQWRYVFKDIGEFYETAEEVIIKDGKPLMLPDGTPLTRTVRRFRDLDALTREQRLCIKEISVTDTGKENIKFYAADDANKELRKLLGFDKQTDGVTVAVTADRSPEERLAALQERIANLQAVVAAGK